jgi:transcription elongation factor GreA
MVSYFSKEGLEALKKELEDLKQNQRIEMAERLRRAKEYGDLSENAEYAEARDAQEALEFRIGELEDLLQEAVVIGRNGKKGVVQVGSAILLKTKGGEKKYVITGSSEADPSQGLISNESPLGLALIGRKEGEEVAVKTPSGEIRYKIVRIE